MTAEAVKSTGYILQCFMFSYFGPAEDKVKGFCEDPQGIRITVVIALKDVLQYWSISRIYAKGNTMAKAIQHISVAIS